MERAPLPLPAALKLSTELAEVRGELEGLLEAEILLEEDEEAEKILEGLVL